MFSFKNATLPSHNSTSAPRRMHAEDLAVGSAIAIGPWATARTVGRRVVIVDDGLRGAAVEFERPETLIDLSGSAQRFVARNRINTGVSILLPAATVGSMGPLCALTRLEKLTGSVFGHDDGLAGAVGDLRHARAGNAQRAWPLRAAVGKARIGIDGGSYGGA